MATSKLEFSRGDQVAGKHEVIDLLDESPLGLTYRVKHLESGRFLRLVMLRPEIAGKQQQAALTAAFDRARKIEHRNVLQVVELGDHDGVAWITFEDFEGQTLRELLQEYKVEGKQLTAQEAGQVTIQVLEALKAIHAAGITQRALRPEYVLIRVRYAGPRNANFVAQVKLVGPALWDLVPLGTLAEDEFTRGEAQYLAPELKSFDPTPTPRSDLFTAGVLFYEMLTGTPPVGTFQAPTQLRPDLPGHVDDVIELAMGFSPEDRYRTAQDAIDDIRRIFHEAETEDPAAAARPMITPLWWALGLLGVLAVAVILYQTRGDPVEEARLADAEARAAVKAEMVFPSKEEIAKHLEGHPLNMIYIPAGPYLAGRLHVETDAPAHEPLTEVRTTGEYLIDAFEYPNSAGGKPKFGVTYDEAEKLCADQGKRLCTADEWEKACKGPGNTAYSYGDYYDPSFCGDGLDEAGYASGEKKDCKSGWGVYDMSGNYREWTATEPPGKDKRRIVKGGLRTQPEKGTRCAFHVDESIGFKDWAMGVRCCRDTTAPPVGTPAPAPPP